MAKLVGGSLEAPGRLDHGPVPELSVFNLPEGDKGGSYETGHVLLHVGSLAAMYS